MIIYVTHSIVYILASYVYVFVNIFAQYFYKAAF